MLGVSGKPQPVKGKYYIKKKRVRGGHDSFFTHTQSQQLTSASAMAMNAPAGGKEGRQTTNKTKEAPSQKEKKSMYIYTYIYIYRLQNGDPNPNPTPSLPPQSGLIVRRGAKTKRMRRWGMARRASVRSCQCPSISQCVPSSQLPPAPFPLFSCAAALKGESERAGERDFSTPRQCQNHRDPHQGTQAKDIFLDPIRK